MHNSNARSTSDYYWRVPHSQGKSKSYSGMHVWSCNYHFTCKDVIIEYYSSHGIVFSSNGKLICAIKLIKQSDLELWIQFIIKNSVTMCNSCFCLWTINLVTSKHSPHKMCIIFQCYCIHMHLIKSRDSKTLLMSIGPEKDETDIIVYIINHNFLSVLKKLGVKRTLLFKDITLLTLKFL